jgi:thymidylate kinase
MKLNNVKGRGVFIMRCRVFWKRPAVTNVSEKLAASIFKAVNLNPEAEGRIFVLNVHKHVQNYMAFRPKR